MLELHLLGPPRLTSDGVPWRPPTRKSMALLAIVAADGAVLRGRLCALLWPALDESTARRNLRRELARLRDGGLEAALRIDADRIALDDAVRTDLAAFRRAAADGGETALDLWRGSFCDGLQVVDAPELEAWMRDRRATLAELRRGVLERSAAAHEAEGRPRAALQQVHRLLADDPLQEQHHRAAIRLQAALGEREAALAQYGRCRELLQAELGLAPMAETEALVASLRGDAGRPAPVGASLPAAAMLPPELPFVGRATEAAAMEDAWRGHRAIVVGGAGGIGKSRLTASFAAAHGPYAAVACHVSDGGVPYASLARVLRTLLAAAEPPAQAWWRGELARVLPELGATPLPWADDTQRMRFLAACADAVLDLAAENFAAVLVDDLHLADAASADAIARVAERLHEAARSRRDVPRLLVTWRDGEAPPSLHATVEALVAADAAHCLALPALQPDEVFDVVRRMSGAAAPQRFSRRLHQATAGNPFFLHETLRHLAATGRLTRGDGGVWETPLDDDAGDYAGLPVPGSVREAVVARVRRAGESVQRVLEAASLAGEPFEARLLAGTTALSDFDAVAAFERAESLQLIVASGAGFRFTHDLLRQSLAAQISAARRPLLHARLAAAAEAVGADAASVAGHWQAAGRPLAARPWWLRAARRAEAAYADADALTMFAHALESGADDADAVEALRATARLLRRADDASGAMTAIDRAVALATRLGLVEAAFEARLEAAKLQLEFHHGAAAQAAYEAVRRDDALPRRLRDAAALGVAETLQQLGRLEDAQSVAEAVLAADPTDADRARAAYLLIVVTYRRGDLAASVRHAEAARAAFERLGDARGRGGCEMRLGVLAILAGDRDRARRHLETARAMAAERRDVQAERDALINLIKLHTDAGDAAGVIALAEAAWHLSPRFAQRETEQILLQAFSYAHGLRGDLAAVLDTAARIEALAERIGEPTAYQSCAVNLSDLYVYLGDLGHARLLLQRAQAESTRELGFLGVKVAFNRAFAEIRGGDVDEARRQLAACGDAATMQNSQDRFTLILRRAELALADGDVVAARAHLASLGEAPNRELEVVRRTCALRAAAAEGQDDSDALAAGRALLADGRSPALEALDLRLACIEAMRSAAPQAHAATAIAAESAAFVAERDRLAETLRELPAARARFEAAWQLPG
ncbi:MAG TPA: BTAD domain-containing putative transcriptional regulator [Caldimonas sp.]|jgi:DNA-binding SARP family transcriptional activator/tetratricopeptide (TPR) repeat protein|nr:BTAD domain-containing putative transcriptional regulator [Caldimonas sp.]HEX2539759.1 BTAD domain-containing putative transcriptional regulator [Caldimonas sp.]